MLQSGQETLLKAGNLVVQRGAAHSWHNHGTTPCYLSIVQIGVKE